MLTEIKLVQNTHWSLHCWYTVEPVWYSEERQMQTGIKQVQKIHTAPYNAGRQPVWYSEKKQMRTGIKLVQKYTLVLTMLVWNHSGIQKKTTANRNQTGGEIHPAWSLQCWYRTTLVFRRKTNANRKQTGTKYTLLLTMLV